MPSTEAKKTYLKKWRKEHIETYNKIQNEYTKKYYHANKEARLEYARNYRLKKKQELEQQKEPNPPI